MLHGFIRRRASGDQLEKPFPAEKVGDWEEGARAVDLCLAKRDDGAGRPRGCTGHLETARRLRVYHRPPVAGPQLRLRELRVF